MSCIPYFEFTKTSFREDFLGLFGLQSVALHITKAESRMAFMGERFSNAVLSAACHGREQAMPRAPPRPSRRTRRWRPAVPAAAHRASCLRSSAPARSPGRSPPHSASTRGSCPDRLTMAFTGKSQRHRARK
eukprot:6185166-Pleurochrysis_carterae.AAC.2